ncbi:MAG: MCE family protein [Gemmatimonadetes bacterium]|uniref:MCE family protein n=1 Tax=Candidatus Kutchimonas denitrificans TaxID=3056748 RepID=A0AAE4Z8D6_9BACT|nr:MCE family protein [Gemmatimonadota bacterium]NIR75714.1 MCE family protein [Candidatus Kutchimonas denitrificans]NIS00327.1 MCE family protein [Gemmatimonadota bacterium]NIT65986.1 MCE family protein [Gemmatimonadota bacterium]NIU53690.1 MCE family protein [Gemmatimonadota bacterium]
MNGESRISWSQIRVGAAVAVALGVLAVAVFFIGETGAVFGDRYNLTTFLPNANGLIEGASVRVAGQDVGKVNRIEFVPVEQRRGSDQVLELTLAIDRNVSNQIRQDSEARIRTQGLLGDKIIDITPGSPGVPMLEEGDTVPSAAAIDYEELFGSASELVDDLAATLRTLRSIADSLLAGQGTMGRLLMDTTLYVDLLTTSRSMNEFLRAVAQGEGALVQLAQDEELYADLRSVIAGVDTLTATLVTGEGTLSRLLTDDGLYRNLASTSARADSLLSALESGEGALGQMLTDQELYESLLKLLVDVQAVVTELRENPRKYVPPIRVF